MILSSQKKKPEPEIEKLKKEKETLIKKIEEYLNGWKRTQADFINYRKQTEQRFIDLVKYAHESLILDLIPIMESFNLAFQHIPKEQRKKDWILGIEQIRRQIENILKERGLKKIETVGRRFNSEVHEVVAYKIFKKIKPETIIEEIAPGYTLNGKVIKPAKVIVAK